MSATWRSRGYTRYFEGELIYAVHLPDFWTAQKSTLKLRFYFKVKVALYGIYGAVKGLGEERVWRLGIFTPYLNLKEVNLY